MPSFSSLASVRATRERLSQLGLSTKKHLGQHFLIDDGVVGKILRLAALEPRLRVVEIGPGIGTLTEALLSTPVDLTAVELDKDLFAAFEEQYPAAQLIGGDALDSSVIALVRKFAPAALVANLPYAVAATVLLEYFQQVPSLEQATIMVQREVAERIMAEPGTKEYGAYTVKLGLLTRVAGSFNVSPQSFYPPPRVSSAVVRLERREFRLASSERTVPPQLITCASMLADAAFFQRRKTIRNSLRAYGAAHEAALHEQGEQELTANRVDVLLAAANIEPTRRGESLTLENYLTLAAAALESH